MTKQADQIIELLGGPKRASEILETPVSTVRSWQTAGFIPAQRQPEVIDLAEKVGIRILPGDFFPGKAKPPSKRRLAMAAVAR